VGRGPVGGGPLVHRTAGRPYFTSEAGGRGPGYVEFRTGDYQHELGIIDRRFAPARACRRPWRNVPQQRLLMFTFPEVVYSVMTFEVPPGVVVCADAHADQTFGESPKLPCPGRPTRVVSAPPDVAADSMVAWFGAAFPAASTNGFEIAASTNAPGLILQSTRTFDQRTSTRRIDLGRHAQVLKDPNVLWLHFLGGLFLVFLQAGSWLARLRERHQAPADKDEL
jgi:hypothetical protein